MVKKKPEGICFISNKGETLPVAWELLKEGVPQNYFILDPTCRGAYAGLMPRIKLDGLQKAIEGAQTIVIDIILKNDQSPGHLAFLDKFNIPHSVPGLFGTLGDKLRKQYPEKDIVGGGRLPERWELNREEGIALAKKVGLSIPDYHKFTSLKEGARFLYNGPGKDKLWVFKPNDNLDLDLTKVDGFKGELLDLLTQTYPKRLGDKVDFILQERIDGQEVSSELWWDGKRFLHPNRTLEDKKLNDDNTGPAVGSQSNTFWKCKDMEGVVHKEMQGLAPFLQGLILPVDANCIVTKDGRANFLEWTFRFGYSALFLFLYLIKKGKLSNFFLKKFQTVFEEAFVASQVLTLHPFPKIREKPSFVQMVKDNLINSPINTEGAWWVDVYQDSRGKLRCAGADGYLGVVMDKGATAEEAIKSAHKRLQTVKKAGISGDLQHRSEADHLSSHLGRLEMLEKWKVNIF